MSSTLSALYLAECLTYDPLNGVLCWRVRPKTHFSSERSWNKFNNEFAGRPVGVAHHGYLRFGLTHNGSHRSFYVHRAVWCLQTGGWPVNVIDHRDGDGMNNRWPNLREATPQQNLRNTSVRSHCKSGIKGVQKTKYGRFAARMTVNKRTIYLGTFDTPEQAQSAFAAHASAVHGPFLHYSVLGAAA